MRLEFVAVPEPHFLIYSAAGTKKPVRVDVQFANRVGVGKSDDILAKAIGWKKNKKLNVIDATVGLGRDLSHFLQLNCTVVGFEKSELLHQALELAFPGVVLFHGDAVDFLLAPDMWFEHFVDAEKEGWPDVVYLDPMFPEKKKSAAAGKESVLLQALCGEPTAAENKYLFSAALKCGARRIVVKRPLKAPTLAATPKPSATYKGKSIRYDVYVVPAPIK